jgi:signal peptidase I
MRQLRRRRGGADCRRFLDILVLLVCGGALLQAFGMEPFQVPTGSMAPALLGHHYVCMCPRCGTEVCVGRPAADCDGRGDTRYYARAFCPRCGELPLPVGDVPETSGDHVLVNRVAYALRRPRRWEVVVFRLFGVTFIKRIVGLPGETVLLRDGDAYIDGKLQRKTAAQAWAMCVPIFKQTEDLPSGWDDLWRRAPAGPADVLDGQRNRQTWTYRHDEKCTPLTDEYAYNAGRHGGGDLVHDFLVEADVERLAGMGTFALRLCDGQDWVEVTLPAAESASVTVRSWPVESPAEATTWARAEWASLLPSGHSRHVAVAFVDRRVSLSIDGQCVVANVDLPAPLSRAGVGEPVQLEAAGTALRIRNFRLFRDVHYTGRGRHAAGAEPVLLGVEQYFVLGDNSANSDDSRFWPEGAVSESQMLGPAFAVHLASRPWSWQCAGRSGEWQLPDLRRIRWIR